MSSRKLNRRKPVRKARGRIVLVLGGAASGKSEYALGIAGPRGPRAFVATGQGLDEEMAMRIARHRATRSADWETVEVPIELEQWFVTSGSHYRTILFDCVTLWLSNLIGAQVKEPDIYTRVAACMNVMRTTSARVVIVMGLVPAEPSTRGFRDLAGRVNQLIAGTADEVYLVVSGIPLRLK
ncbi:MAG: bifunctional adenosylcobinamide kinase/adenosylcobinamide-phosphate guanylyltransferase [Nitrospira sp.]|nr:bifunctional adenosylcobinamide kinase/adenosylcobinamide-phosphate guanylyltransferase [Nitrospira sp.]